MSSTITAGNATNGLAIASDITGALEFKTGSGAGTTALTLNASQNATFAGTITSSTGTLYPLTSGTAVTASGTSVDFTNIPSWVKRVTVMLSGNVSLSGSAALIVQIGTVSGIETTGYAANAAYVSTTNNTTRGSNYTAGFGLSAGTPTGADTFTGVLQFTLFGTNLWLASGNIYPGGTGGTMVSGSKTLAGTLARVRVTSSNGTDTFDAGTINILWE